MYYKEHPVTPAFSTLCKARFYFTKTINSHDIILLDLLVIPLLFLDSIHSIVVLAKFSESHYRFFRMSPLLTRKQFGILFRKFFNFLEFDIVVLV